jgi:hypothetical protein
MLWDGRADLQFERPPCEYCVTDAVSTYANGHQRIFFARRGAAGLARSLPSVGIHVPRI